MCWTGRASTGADHPTHHAATLCLRVGVQWKGRDDLTRCVRIDLATGAQTTAPIPPEAPVAGAPEPPKPAKPYTIEDTAKRVAVCRTGHPCVKLALKPLPDVTEEPRGSYAVAVSADGTRAVASPPFGKRILVFETTTGKQVATAKILPATGDCVGLMTPAVFLGNSIYVPVAACNETAASARLFDKNAKPLALLDALDVEWSEPVHLDGDTWAIAGSGGDGVEVVDVATGKVAGLVAHTPKYTPTCPYCGTLDVTTSIVPPLARTPSGRLLEFSAGIAIFDPAVSAVAKHLPLAVCATPASPPPP